MNQFIVVSDDVQRRHHLQDVSRKAFAGLDVWPRIKPAEPLMKFKGYLAAGIMEYPPYRTVVILDDGHLWDEEWFAVVAELRRHQFNCHVLVVMGKNSNRDRVLNDGESIIIMHNPAEEDFVLKLRDLIHQTRS